MAISFLSHPTTRQTFCYQRTFTDKGSWLPASTTFVRRPPRFIVIPLRSSSMTTKVAEPDAALSVQSESATENADEIPFSGCRTCGKEEIERGCNGEGRIQGGIATVPGFGWWPIKAYRPCPQFVASGGRYKRQGQSMDEVAWGRGERETPAGTAREVESSKKRADLRRFKR